MMKWDWKEDAKWQRNWNKNEGPPSKSSKLCFEMTKWDGKITNTK